MLKKLPPIVISFAILNACSTAPKSSGLKFAHAPSNQLSGTPIGHIEFMKAGYKHNFGEKLKICVESGKQFISDNELLLETKLAHAMWLNAAGYDASYFEMLSFELQDKCKATDARFTSVVVLADRSKEVSGDDYDKQFSSAKITCEATELKFSCKNSGALTVGWGRAASMSHRYLVSNPEKWTQVSREDAGLVLLSHNVDWTNLIDGISTNDKIDSDLKSSIKTAYAELLELTNPSFDSLNSFADLLVKSDATIANDSKFNQLFQEYFKAKKAVENEPYKIKLAAFHTLLHEVGHTFGMVHADNPSMDSVTGSSTQATQDPVTMQFKTDKSTMAYADSYAYLTEDDQLGVTSVKNNVEAEVLKHK